MRSPRPPRLYVIADVDALGLSKVGDAVTAMADSGVRWIQLRAKRASGATWCRLAETCCDRLTGSEVRLWIDDRVDVAAMLPVGGVHVGQQDLPPRDARAVLGDGVAIGQSTHNASQLAVADTDSAVDVIAVGPVFPTRSKADAAPVVGLERVRDARRATSKPLVAIGGIDATNASAVLEAGADTVAVLGAVCRGDVAINCRRLMAAVEESA